MFEPLWKFVRRIVGVVLLLIGLFMAAELARISLMAYRFHPIVGMGVAALFAVVALVLFVRWITSPRIPAPLPRPIPEQVPASVLIRYARYLNRYLAYLGRLPALDRETQKRTLRAAVNIEDLLRAHPIKDDLTRLLDQSARDILTPAFTELRTVCDNRIRETIAETMKDAHQGPFSGGSASFAYYRAFRMCAAILRTYHPDITFTEWADHLRRMMMPVFVFPLTRIGRLLAEGLSHNSAARPETVDNIARSLTIGWVLAFSRQIAFAVCEEGAGLNRVRADGWRDKECFMQAAEFMVTDISTSLKNRLRATGDPNGEMPFLDHLSGAMQKAYENVLRTLPESEEEPDEFELDRMESSSAASLSEPAPRSHHRRHHSKRRRGAFNMLFTLGQRIKYGVRGQRINRRGL